jgi:hypothetical protein
MGIETFIISLQASFVMDDQVRELLAYVGNLKSAASAKFTDDGVTQQATVRTGIAQVENKVVPNPVTLAPYRTFQEIDQPTSQYIFRMKRVEEQAKPQVALHQCDDIAWGIDAVEGISNWLKYRIKTDGVSRTIIA